MKADEFSQLISEVFDKEIFKLSVTARAEYANDAEVFSNFNKLALELGTEREKILWVYAMKHKDGIASWLRGNNSQRESVKGRINDLIVYLFILRAMIDEREKSG